MHAPHTSEIPIVGTVMSYNEQWTRFLNITYSGLNYNFPSNRLMVNGERNKYMLPSRKDGSHNDVHCTRTLSNLLVLGGSCEKSHVSASLRLLLTKQMFIQFELTGSVDAVIQELKATQLWSMAGMETWNISAEDERLLSAFEHNVVRRKAVNLCF